MILALLLLLLALLGVLPWAIALPVSGGSILIGAVGLYLLQRRLRKTPVQTGTEGMVGRLATTITSVERTGRIRCGSETWNARSEDGPLNSGDVVRIVSFDGLKAVIRAAASDHGR